MQDNTKQGKQKKIFDLITKLKALLIIEEFIFIIRNKRHLNFSQQKPIGN